MGLGDSVFLEAVAVDQYGHRFIGAPSTWSSSNPQVATTTSTGIVMGVALGKDTVTATSEGYTAQATVTVVPPSQIALSVDSVAFSAVASSSNPAPDTVFVTNAGVAPLKGLAVGPLSYSAGANGWLTVALSGTTAPATIVLAALTGNLARGTYAAAVPVTAPHASNSPQVLKVTFTVS